MHGRPSTPSSPRAAHTLPCRAVRSSVELQRRHFWMERGRGDENGKNGASLSLSATDNAAASPSPSLPPPPDIVSQPTPNGLCDMRKIACPLVATACTPCRRPCPIVTTSNRRPTSPRSRDRASQFYQNTVFNRDLSGWNVGKVTTMAYMVRRSRAKLGDAAASPPLRLVITPSRLRLLYHLAMNWITHRKVRT